MRPRILLVDGIGRAPCYTEPRAALEAEWLLEVTSAIEREAGSTIDLAIVSHQTARTTCRRPGRSRLQHQQDGREIEALRRRLAGGVPMARLRAAVRTVLPRRLWRLLAGRRHHPAPAGRQLPSWAGPARATTPSPSARSGREGPDA